MAHPSTSVIPHTERNGCLPSHQHDGKIQIWKIGSEERGTIRQTPDHHDQGKSYAANSAKPMLPDFFTESIGIDLHALFLQQLESMRY